MSKSAQRKNNVVAIGRNHALKGGRRDENPYRPAGARALWYQGWDQGDTLRRKNHREDKRKRRTSSSRLWRGWYGLMDLLHGELRAHRPAQTPARRRGLW